MEREGEAEGTEWYSSFLILCNNETMVHIAGVLAGKVVNLSARSNQERLKIAAD